MKRLTSFLLVIVLLLSMAPAVYADEATPAAPDKIDAKTDWSYLDDGSDPAGDPNAEGYNRTSWTLADFDDRAWETGSGSFGAKDGGAFSGATVQLAGCPGDENNIPTYYFRTTVNVTDASAVTAITGGIAYDDAVILYINGVKVKGFNDAGCDSNSSFCTNIASASPVTESFTITDSEALAALKNGENVVAVELHNRAAGSSDIYFAMSDMTFSTEALPTASTLVNSDTRWSYWDRETDPIAGTDYEQYNVRTIWTYGAFLQSDTWKWAAGPFGAKKGAIDDLGGGCTPKTLLNQYKEDGSTDIEAYFFVTTFNVTADQLEETKQILGSLYYDDCAIVYLNHAKVASFDEPDGGFTQNMEYGGSNAGSPKLGEFALTDVSALQEGTNILAVEIHQGRASSSDIYFDFQSLTLSTEAPDYSGLTLEQDTVALSVGADETKMNFTWYASTEKAGTIAYAPVSDLVNGAMPENAATATAVATTSNRGGYYSNQLTLTGLQPDTTYAYQLTNTKGEEVVTSDIATFTTGGGETTKFLFVGDPQLGSSSNLANDTDGWNTTLEKAVETFPEATFLFSAGDQVDAAASEEQYQSYLNRSVLSSLPQATTIGNHDSSSNAYDQHFNVPNESDQYGVTPAGGDYYFVYNDVLFLVLNTNDLSTAKHKAFMETAIKDTQDQDIQWKIVTFHQSIYTVASHYNNDGTARREELAPVFDSLGIDVVLQGHDHVYCRTYMMDVLDVSENENYTYGNGEDKAPTAVTDPTGILYVTANSASGSKYYDIKTNLAFPYAAVMNQEKVPNVSYVEIDDSHFTITTYRTSDMSVVDSFTIYRTAEQSEEPAKLLIDQVYGGGGKGNTPISNSFVELYNPNDKAVDLTGYKLVNGTDTLDLTGTIPAKGSYLIVGAAESTSDEYLTYDLPTADQTCNWTISNKNYTIKLMNGETEIDSVTANDKVDAIKVSKQKTLKRVDHADTDTNDDFQIIVWEKSEVTVNEAYVTAYAPRNSKGEMGSVHGASSEPTYTPVVTGNTRVNGYYDATGSLKLELAGRYNSGAMNADGGSLEIVQYNPVNGYAYAVSGVKGKLIAVDLNGKLDGDTVVELSGTEYDVKSLVNGFAYGDMTSVAISPDGSKLAVAIQAENYADAGVVALFACNPDGSLELLSTVSVGVQPDMVTFADDSTILSADEGEPRNGVNGTDPKGSVSIVTIGENNALTAKIVTFESFDDQRSALTTAGVLIQKDTQPSTDFEPEYIAVSGKTAYVSLQEANAIAVLDIDSGTFTGVYPLGFQDYSVTKVDLQKNDTVELDNYPNVYGIKMPDGIAVTTIGGKTYLLTANEGDSRADWEGLDNESESTTSPTGGVTVGKKVVWFNANLWDGLDTEKAYVFGGRSFSIYEVTANGLNLVYDSGSGFEEITAEKLPAYFNTSNDKNSVDNRSGKKGPEPESVVTGVVDGKTYAFIALERIGGVMVYDITDPANTEFVNYINSREFDEVIKGDVSPEGLCFVSASDSKTGNALLLTACEVSGTLAVYELTTPAAPVNPTVPTAPAKPAEPAEPEQSEGRPFKDVKTGDWFYDAVAYVYNNGMMNGTSDTVFAPNAAVTRGMIVTILYRLEGSPAVSGAAAFGDVPAGQYYTDAVAWASAHGIVTGYDAATFGPNDPITREQLAAILYRYAAVKGYDTTGAAALDGFTDASAVSAYASAALAWAVDGGLVNGMGDGTLAPQNGATRAQAAAILMRFAESIVE